MAAVVAAAAVVVTVVVVDVVVVVVAAVAVVLGLLLWKKSNCWLSSRRLFSGAPKKGNCNAGRVCISHAAEFGEIKCGVCLTRGALTRSITFRSNLSSMNSVPAIGAFFLPFINMIRPGVAQKIASVC